MLHFFMPLTILSVAALVILPRIIWAGDGRLAKRHQRYRREPSEN